MKGYLYRIKSVRRILLDIEIENIINNLKDNNIEKLLDIGAKNSPYIDSLTKICDDYMTLDIDINTNPDICGDIHNINWEDNYFDVVVATEVLEHLHDPKLAINQINRILKPGGICILSVPFLYPYHPDPQDFYRYTIDGLYSLFQNFTDVKVEYHGNRLQVIWLLFSESKKTLGLFSWLNPIIALLGKKNKACPLGYTVVAIK